MKCEESVELLSEYYEETLDEAMVLQVRTHLVDCPPCYAIMEEIVLIIQSARALQNDEGVLFPDEDTVWQRMNFTQRATH